MNTKHDLKSKTAPQSLKYYRKEELVEVITSENIRNYSELTFLNSAEIITPQPYSVFALCKLYEYFQRN